MEQTYPPLQKTNKEKKKRVITEGGTVHLVASRGREISFFPGVPGVWQGKKQETEASGMESETSWGPPWRDKTQGSSITPRGNRIFRRK